MIDDTTIDYILNYFSRFMTLEEAAAMKHYITTYKFPRIASAHRDDKTRADLLERGWLSGNRAVTDLLRGGYLQFRRNTAERILKEKADDIYFNLCPACGRLARTPQAKQCRYCAHNWHMTDEKGSHPEKRVG